MSFPQLIGQFEPERLLLAQGVSLAAMLCVFKIRSRMRNTTGTVRSVWIFIAGLELGVALWASQFLGLLSFSPIASRGVAAAGVLSAVIPAAAGSILALSIIWSGPDRGRRMAGALVLTTVMALLQVMRFSLTSGLDAGVFDAAKVWAALVLCSAVFYGGFALAGEARRTERRLASAVLMSVGLLVVHLTMVIAIRPEGLGAAANDLARASGMLVALVMLVSVMLIGGGLSTAYIDEVQSATTVLRLRRLADAAREGIVVVKRGRINDANAFFCGLVGQEVGALLGRQLLGDFLRIDCVGEEGLRPGEFDGWVECDGAEAIPVHVRVADGQVGSSGEGHTIVSMRDLREQKAAELQIQYLADHDGLTGLPNRRALIARLGAEIARQSRTRSRIWVVSINLDRFTQINELFGQETGDAMLVETARRIREFIGDEALAARLGGDEFVVTRTADASQTDLALAEWTHFLLGAIRAPMTLFGRELQTGVSAGVSLYPEDGSDADRLLVCADIALRRAKSKGRDSYCFFEAEMDQAVRERGRLARDLRDAIGSSQFEVHYQPIASAADQRICGFEALTRWRHPEHGMVPPDKFITLAEQEGLILALGDWVLRAAAEEAASWPDDISISVNLSPMQLTEPDLAGKVRQILFETGLAARRLVLEVTETALITDQQAALDALRRLKAMGLRIAMDDFGTGFSSLSTLHSFPFDKIKIDKQFVDGIGRDARSAVIVKAVLGIGRGLGVPVVAEGVETIDQLAFLRAEGCDELQGYFIGRPAPAATFGDVLSSGGAPVQSVETPVGAKPAEVSPEPKPEAPAQPPARKARAAGFR